MANKQRRIKLAKHHSSRISASDRPQPPSGEFDRAAAAARFAQLGSSQMGCVSEVGAIRSGLAETMVRPIGAFDESIAAQMARTVSPLMSSDSLLSRIASEQAEMMAKLTNSFGKGIAEQVAQGLSPTLYDDSLLSGLASMQAETMVRSVSAFDESIAAQMARTVSPLMSSNSALSRIATEQAEMMAKFTNSFGESIADQAARTISPLMSSNSALSRIASEQAEMMVRFTRESLQVRLAEMNQFIWSEIPAFTRHVEEITRIIHLQEEEERYAAELAPVFEEAGLWLSPSMPMTIWWEVRSLHVRWHLTASILQSFILNAFQENDYELLRGVVDGWFDHPSFQHRRRLIRAALEAHIRGEYALSIPPLLIVAEGIMRETSGGSFHTRRLQSKLERILPDWELGSVSILPFTLAFYQIYIRNLGEAVRLDQEPESFCRNIIFHGRDPDYDKPLNSLRGFLFLDMLHLLISEFQYIWN